MILNKPKRLIAVINGFEIGVESTNENQDASEFETFCTAFIREVNGIVAKPGEAKAEEAKVN